MEQNEFMGANMVWLGITVALLAVLPVIFTIFWKIRCKKKVSLFPLLVGAAGFFISVRVLELGLHMVCIIADNPVSRFINGHTAAYVIYGITAAGVFEEVGRYLIIRFIMKKNKTRENMVMYGIGHGGIEVYAITLLSMINLLVIGLTVQKLGVENAAPALGVTEAVLPQYYAILSQIAGFGPGSMAVAVLERLLAMLIHISLTVVVFYGIAERKNKYLLLAIGAHMAIDVFPALYQRQAVSILVTEAMIFIGCVFVSVWAKRLYDRMRKG